MTRDDFRLPSERIEKPARELIRRQQEALERDAFAYRELMDPHELPGDARAEALRRTARGAAEDWLEAKSNAAEREQMFRMAEGDAD